MKAIVELTETDFDETIAKANLPIVVDFYAAWCGPCKMLAPLLENLAGRFAGRIEFVKVNVDDAPGLAERFMITGVPTLLFLKKGGVCDTMVGFSSPRDLAAKLDAFAADRPEVPV